MAIKFHSTATGVVASAGRGADQIVVDFSFKEIERWAQYHQVNEAKEWHRAFGAACSGLKKQLRSVMNKGGGVCGVPKFKDYEDFTKELRAIEGRSSDKMGGVLAERSSIVAFRRNGAQIIGWPDGMAKLVTAFQDGKGSAQSEARFVDPECRRQWHRKGIKVVPRAYVHNPRQILQPYFEDHVRLNLNDWATKVYFKNLTRRMVRSGEVK